MGGSCSFGLWIGYESFEALSGKFFGMKGLKGYRICYCWVGLNSILEFVCRWLDLSSF